MPRIFGILFKKEGAIADAESFEKALSCAGLRQVTGLGAGCFLAVSPDSFTTILPYGQMTRILIEPRAPGSIDSRQPEPTQRNANADETLKTLNGPFTDILIASPERQRIAIDRFGQQRIVYFMSKSGEVIFASDIDLLRHHPDAPGQIDPQAIYNYLFFHVIPSPKSIFKDIFKLPAAHLLEADRTGIRLRRYWAPQFGRSLSEPVASKARAVVPAVTTAVRRCGSTPDPGAFLSGGLDSSTICGVLQSICSQPAMAFSVGFASEGYDEIQFAEAVANHFGLDHRVHYITPQEVSSAVPRVAQAYDEPFGNSSAVPTLVCAEFARSCGVDHLLAGDGGDEIFSGNTRYRKQKIFESYFLIPRILRSNIIEPLFASHGDNSPLGRGPLRKITRYVDQALVPLPDRLETHNMLRMVALTNVLEPEFMRSIDLNDPLNMMRREWDSLGDSHYQDKMLHLDWKFTLADNDLRKVSEMTQLAGVRVCYPLLDNDVVDLAISIPAEVRMPGNKLRHFYKQAVRSFLPEKTLTKSKHGFGLPFGEWARTDAGLRDITMGSLRALRGRRILKESFLQELQRQHMEDHAGFYGTMIWVLMMLELWLSSHDQSI